MHRLPLQPPNMATPWGLWPWPCFSCCAPQPLGLGAPSWPGRLFTDHCPAPRGTRGQGKASNPHWRTAPPMILPQAVQEATPWDMAGTSGQPLHLIALMHASAPATPRLHLHASPIPTGHCLQPGPCISGLLLDGVTDFPSLCSSSWVPGPTPPACLDRHSKPPFQLLHAPALGSMTDTAPVLTVLMGARMKTNATKTASNHSFTCPHKASVEQRPPRPV